MPKFISNKFTTDIMSLLTQASLIVTPNGYKEGKLYSVIPSDGSGDMSVTRATTATRVNSAGLVELVPYNLVQYSEDFANGYWINFQSSETSNNTTAPNGTLTADRLTQTGVGGGSIYTTNMPLTGIMTLSCYFKAGSIDEVIMDSAGTSAYWGVKFNLTTQAITYFGVGANATIASVGNGWFRCSVSADVTGTNYVAFGLLGAVNDYVYLWGAQLNEGTLKPYQKTETRLNIPRLDYSNGTCPSILVEPQRTNSCINSNTFNASGWNANGIASYTKVANPITGINDATKIVKTTGNSDPYFQQGVGAANGTWTYSMWLWTDSGQPTTAAFYMFNSTVTEFFALPITLTNVPTRYTFTSTFANTGGLIFIRTVLSGADANQYIYAYGGQVEFGSYATSYIPTTSASVTRNADVISKTGISSLIGQTEGTLFVEVDFTDASISMLLQLFDGVSDVMAIYTGSNSVFFDGSNGSAQWSISGSLPNGHHKLALAYKANDIAVYIDGTLIGTDTSAAVPTTDQLYLNANVYQSFIEKQRFNAVALWKTRLTNTQLEALTGTGFNTYAEMASYYNYVLQ